MQKTDQNQLRFNQILLVAGIPLGFVLGWTWVVALLFALMLSQHLGFDGLVWLKRTLRIRPQIVDEDPRPHRFARTVGAVFLGTATVAFALGSSLVGWALAFVVAGLALLSLTTQICVGCLVYFQFKLLRHRLSR